MAVSTGGYEQENNLDMLLSSAFDAAMKTEKRVVVDHLDDDLTAAEIRTIVACGMGQGDPMSVVASRLDITLATLTASVGKLVAKGYIERSRSSADKRQVIIRLTREGRRVYRAYEAFRHQLINEAMQELSAEQHHVLCEALVTLCSYLERKAAS